MATNKNLFFKHWPFFWGVATNAFQIEGARNIGNRTDSIWDIFTRKHWDATVRASLPHEMTSIATSADYYHKFELDNKILHFLGINIFAYYIDWTRIIPEPNFVNNEGVRFYKKVFMTIKQKAITPFIVLFHWDTPLWLEKLSGLKSLKEVKKHFTFYARTVFQELGKMSDFWIVTSENWTFAYFAYMQGLFPPNKKNDLAGFVQVLHSLNVMTNIAKREFDGAKTKGLVNARAKLGTNTDFCPGINLTPDAKLSKIYLDWNLHLTLQPVFQGTYPDVFYDFIEEHNLDVEINDHDLSYLKKHPLTLLSWNFYRPQYFTALTQPLDSDNERKPSLTHLSNKFVLVWPKKVSGEHLMYTKWLWLIKPEYLYKGLKTIQTYYPDVPIFIGENGYGDADQLEIINDQNNQPISCVLDYDRITFLKQHVEEVMRARKNNLNIVGYLSWTYCDIFSPSGGYQKKYGLVRVDFNDKNLIRTPKLSFVWYKKLVQSDGKNILDINDPILKKELRIFITPQNWKTILK